MLLQSVLISASALLSIVPSSAAQYYSTPCLLFGPDYPTPTNLSHSVAINTATQNFRASLQAALTNATAYGQLDPVSTSFSIDVYSLTQETPLFTSHYSAPALSKPAAGVATVDSNTIYRIGSTSKLWTVYLYLIEAGDLSFNDPITKYIPELAAYANANTVALNEDDVDITNWNDVTVGALASQLAGIARDAAPAPSQDAKLAAAGLPPVPGINGSFCGNPAQEQIPCDRASFFSDFFIRHPVVPPFHTPIYSNAAYQIFAYALENITSKPFTSLFADDFITPLALNATSYNIPAYNASSIIPDNATVSWYNALIGDETPAGGYYSSLNDMRKVGISILNSTFLSPAQTRRWMKPHTFTSNPNVLVGAPWEILRAPSKRPSWMYTKEGDLGLYGSEVIFLPDYGVGFTVLAAGAHAVSNVRILSDLLAATYVPALEAAAKEEANTVYAGTYSNAATNSTMTVTTNSDPGLVISEWTFNGSNVLALYTEIAGNASTQHTVAHLYPSGLQSKNGSIVGWRAVIEVFPKAYDPGAFSENCDTWTGVDFLVYGGIAVDEFIFNFNADATEVVSIEPRLLRFPLTKKPGMGRLVRKREERRWEGLKRLIDEQRSGGMSST